MDEDIKKAASAFGRMGGKAWADKQDPGVFKERAKHMNEVRRKKKEKTALKTA